MRDTDEAYRIQAGAPFLWVALDVIDAMVAEAEDKYPLETGGVLLGYRDEASNALVVRAAVGPGPEALHERFRFVPDHIYHRSEVARIYKASGRRWSYLGDWHTHPEGQAAMSRADRTTLSRIARSEAARLPRPIMLILGQLASRRRQRAGERVALGSRWHLAAWQYRERYPARRRLYCQDMGIEADSCTILTFDAGSE